MEALTVLSEKMGNNPIVVLSSFACKVSEVLLVSALSQLQLHRLTDTFSCERKGC